MRRAMVEAAEAQLVGPYLPPGPGAGTSSIRPNGMDSEGGVGGGGGTLSEDLFKPGK
ncbi:hypothetical protein SERLA73DRAFT_74505 [Serpula lacrymans var. lacrymans S7.3]|uniref:Uncharacterized protein n=1 Tax=Serpula lacrymans var. lacrymans (strain S7.3) TaxID=936435 RepID=F8PZF8_SERL3|nr:hypothetical protein SERLA73DRAFT_74505 [Serpula lacrymans var. lacrymans S7.3]